MQNIKCIMEHIDNSWNIAENAKCMLMQYTLEHIAVHTRRMEHIDMSWNMPRWCNT